MIQIKNANVSQSFVVNLNGYSSTSTAQPLLLIWTNQLTGGQFFFVITPDSTNERYTQMSVTPGLGAQKMQEGLYLVNVYDSTANTVYASRLAFVSDTIPYGEAGYESYTGGDTTAYDVYIKP